jgi:hypothetical protein
VISIGAFSAVLALPWIKPALAKRVAINKTCVRMAHAERTALEAPCKAKSTPRNKGSKHEPVLKAKSSRVLS